MASKPANSELTTRRRWLFRLGAIAIGLSLVALLEIALRLFGVANYSEPAIPMVGFSEIRPLFMKNDAGDRYEIPKSRQVFFQPDSFAVQKPADEFRIFCLGGSTVKAGPIQSRLHSRHGWNLTFAPLSQTARGKW